MTTKLVFEFTELQGFIGADYARVSGEDTKVAEGIKEHYFPLNAESEIAKGIEGQIVGIADKIDTICAVFVDGKKPTGSSDPLGVRRACLGIIRTILADNLKIDLSKLIKEALALLPVQKDCADEINEFLIQRLIIFLSENYKKNVLEACASNKNPLEDLTDYIERVKVVQTLDCPELLESANRVIRILKDECTSSVNPSLFKENAESMLYEKVSEINKTSDYKAYLEQLLAVNPFVEKFFVDVLVNDKDEKIKENRRALVALLKNKYELLTDFSKL